MWNLWGADTGAQIIQGTKIIAKWNDDIKRREKSAKYLDYYNNICKSWFDKKVNCAIDSETERAETKKYFRNMPLTNEIIDKISLVFNSGLSVELITDSDEQKEEFNNFMKNINLQANMIEVDRMCNLLKDVLVVPAIVDKQVKLNIITPNLYFVIQDEDDPTVAKAVVYQVGIVENTAVAEVTTKHIMIDKNGFWDVEISYTGEVLSKNYIENQLDYNTAPFVIFRNYVPTTTFFSEENSSIVETHESINWETSNLMYSLDRDYPMMIAKNVPAGVNIPIGRSALQVFNDDPSGQGTVSTLEFLSADYNIQKAWDSIKEGKNQEYNKNNLSYLANNTTFTSGFQMMMAKSELYEANNINAIYYKNSLRKLIDLLIQSANQLGYKVPSDVKYSLNIKTPQIILSPLEKEQVRASEIMNGSKNVIDHMLEDDADLTREEAIKIYKQKQTEIESELRFTNEVIDEETQA